MLYPKYFDILNSYKESGLITALCKVWSIDKTPVGRVWNSHENFRKDPVVSTYKAISIGFLGPNNRNYFNGRVHHIRFYVKKQNCELCKKTF